MMADEVGGLAVDGFFFLSMLCFTLVGVYRWP